MEELFDTGHKIIGYKGACHLTRGGESHIACEYHSIEPERHTNRQSSSIASQTKLENQNPANGDVEQKGGYGTVEKGKNQPLRQKKPSQWYDNGLSEQSRYERKGVGASDS